MYEYGGLYLDIQSMNEEWAKIIYKEIILSIRTLLIDAEMYWPQYFSDKENITIFNVNPDILPEYTYKTVHITLNFEEKTFDYRGLLK